MVILDVIKWLQINTYFKYFTESDILEMTIMQGAHGVTDWLSKETFYGFFGVYEFMTLLVHTIMGHGG